MSPEETPPTPLEDEPLEEDEGVDVDVMYATSTAFGSAHVGELEAAQTAIGSASIDGDATLSASAVGMMTAKGVTVSQSWVGAAMVDGDASLKQCGSSAVLGEHIEVSNGAAALMWAQEASASHSWIGVVAARDITLSDDSRVLIDVKAALIIAAAVLGGFGLIAAIIAITGRRFARRLPHLPNLKLPDLHDVKLPDLSHIATPDLHRLIARIAKMRHAS